jgi:hypothetical protein
MMIDGYVRVSQVRGRAGPSFISPLDQRGQIEAWAQANGTRRMGVRPSRRLKQLDTVGTPTRMAWFRRSWALDL